MKKLNCYGSFLLAGILTLPVFAIEAPSGSKPPSPTPPAGPVEALEEEVPIPARPAPAPLSIPRVNPVATAYLGIGGYHVPELLALHLGLKSGEGLVISSLDPAGPAVTEGFVQNDVITRADGSMVGSREDLTRVVQTKRPGDKITVDFIHEGKPDRREITLANRPEGSTAAPQSRTPLDRMLQNLPQDQARRIRESIEQNLHDADHEALQGETIPQMDDAIGEMRKRAEKMFEGMRDPREVEPGVSSVSSIRLLDDEGSVEVKSRNGGKEVRVLDKRGKEVWAGPWNSEEDKAAAPQEVRQRVERLNFDMETGGNGLRLRLGPQMEQR